MTLTRRRRLAHLAKRFFTSISKRPPLVDEVEWANQQLLAGEQSLWAQMTNPDRRHSIVVARRFVVLRPGATRSEIAGALLHDIGKLECRLGTFARVVASSVGPIGKRFSSYHDHERIGVALAVEAGSDSDTILLIAGRGLASDALRTADEI